MTVTMTTTTSDEERANRDEWLSSRYMPNGGNRCQKSVDCTYDMYQRRWGVRIKVLRSFAIGNQLRLVTVMIVATHISRKNPTRVFKLFVNYKKI